MGKITIIFILNSLEQQRCHKRIREFIAHGYDVKVYAFNRELGVGMCRFDEYDVEIIGEIDNSRPYYSRVGLMRKAIKKVIHDAKGVNCVYYLFNLDVASVAFLMLQGRSYVYEESDLTHTYISNKIMRKVMELLDEHIIRKSLMTIMTSGGFVKYHFKDVCPDNVWVIPNRLNPHVKDMPIIEQQNLDICHLRFGFVGLIRGKALANFVKVLVYRFPQHEMHFFGVTDEVDQSRIKGFEAYENVYFHGAFTNPIDLPSVYSQIDIVISTYDTSSENVLYAEPNKLYEAMYYETPIVVSSGTYLAERVEKLGIGYAIDAMNDEKVEKFIASLTEESLRDKKNRAALLDKELAINENSEFFARFKQKILQIR